MKRRYCKHVMCRTCMKHRQCLPCQCRERFCVAECLIQSYLSLLVSQPEVIHHHSAATEHHHSAATHHHHHRCDTQLSYLWKLHECRANNNYFLYICFYFFSMYLVLFSIVFYRTIVTVYTNNIFLHNYLWKMHQIIHLSLVGCFTPARGKTVQNNREVIGVNIRYCMRNLRGQNTGPWGIPLLTWASLDVYPLVVTNCF